MIEPAQKPSWTTDTYFAMEQSSQEKHEFWRGEVYGMAGASPAHNLVTANVIVALNNAVRALPCRVYASDLKVHVPATNGFVYPDVTLGCDAPRFHPEHPEVLLNPRVIVAVLSESTERFDGGEKFAGYRTLPSLTDYVLVSQVDRRVEHYARQHDGSWSLRDFGPGDAIAIASVGISLSIDEIYRKVFDDAAIGT